MLIYSQKRKKIADCAAISVERIVGGGKEGKFALVGSAGFGTMCDGILAVYPDEKNSRGRAGKNICRFRKRRRLLSYMRKDMDKTTVKRLSCITLIIMGFGGLLLAVSEICGGFLPDIAVRIIGIADIICLTLFVFLFVLVSRK